MNAAPNRRRATVIQLVFGYAGIGISIAQGILLVPLYLRFVGAHMYGLWLATGGVIFWLSVLDLGVASVMGQRIAAAFGRRENDQVRLFYHNGILLQYAMLTVLLVLSLAAAYYVPISLAADDEIAILQRATYLACVALALSLANNAQKNTADALQRPLVPQISLLAGAAIGIGITVRMLYTGSGIISIPAGMTFGASISLGANTIYVRSLMRKVSARGHFEPKIFRELMALSPAMVGSRLGESVVARIEPTLISAFLSPEIAVSYAVSRRVADVVQLAVDKIGGSVAAGVSHMFAEGDIERLRTVLRLVTAIAFAAAVIMLSVYVGINHAFVSLWVGNKEFAGQQITVLVAVGVFTSIASGGISYVLGATGEIAPTCWLLTGEAISRLSLMLLLLHFCGVVGIPLAIAISCGCFSLALLIKLLRRIEVPFRGSTVIRRLVVAGVALFLSSELRANAPGGILATIMRGGLIAIITGGLVIAADGTLRQQVALVTARVRVSRRTEAAR